MEVAPVHIFNVYKATEGGLGQKSALGLLKDIGIKAYPVSSIYIGQTAVAVLTNDKRKLRRVENLLYGRL